MTSQRRRRFLITGATAVVAALAGCGEAANDQSGESPDPMTDDENESAAESGEEESGGGTPQDRVNSHLTSLDARGYDGEIADHTGEESVTVAVGAGDGLAFGPPAIQIDRGTTIVWEWTGEGGAHNVVPSDESDITGFGEEETIDEQGYTVEDTFEEDGVGLYYCEPHQATGMHGAFIVGDGGMGDDGATGNQTEGGQAGGNQTEGGQTGANQTEDGQAGENQTGGNETN